MPVTYQQWKVQVKACGNFFTWSNELKEFDSAFKKYDFAKTDGKKEEAYKCFKKWYESNNSRCMAEQQKLKAYCQKVRDTLQIKMVKKGTSTYKPQPMPIKQGVYIGFRGLGGASAYDEPSNIAKVGFALWPQAQREGKWIGPWFTTKIFKDYKDSASFARYCIAAKDRSRPTIATSLNDQCGGYTGKYTYRFEIPNLKEVIMTKNVLGISEDIPWKLPLKMYIDQSAHNVDSSRNVAINLNVETHEVVFLTKIDPKYIVQYRVSGNKSWQNMPA